MSHQFIEFEWDPIKAESNLAKHHISFETATEVFLDPFAIFEEDRFSMEELREVATGLTREGILVVISTERHDGIIRLISARRATRNERTRYQNSRSGHV